MRAFAPLLFVLPLLVLAPRARADEEQQWDTVERVVAVVNDDPIFLSDVRRRAVPFLGRIQQAPELQRAELLHEVYRQATEHLIDETLIAQAAHHAQVHVTREDVDRALHSVMRSNHLEEDQFWDAVRGQGYTESAYREDVKRQITRLRLLNERLRGHVSITEDDVRSEYARQLREARGQASFVAADILVPVPDGATATEIASVHRLAENLRTQITPSGWDAAMTEHGGVELGTLHQGDLDPALESVLLELAPGQIGSPVRTAAGYHILFLRSREAGTSQLPPYDDAKTVIYNHLLESQMAREEVTFLADLRRQATIVQHVEF